MVTTLLTVIWNALTWIKDHKAAALAMGLSLALAFARVQLWLAREELQAASAAAMASKDQRKVLEAEIDKQTAAVADWRFAAQAAQEQAQVLRAAAETSYQRELAKARALIVRSKDPTTCPQAWDRLFQALDGINYTGAP